MRVLISLAGGASAWRAARAGRIGAARLRLSKSLDPVSCGRDVIRDCPLFDPVR